MKSLEQPRYDQMTRRPKTSGIGYPDVYWDFYDTDDWQETKARGIKQEGDWTISLLPKRQELIDYLSKLVPQRDFSQYRTEDLLQAAWKLTGLESPLNQEQKDIIRGLRETDDINILKHIGLNSSFGVITPERMEQTNETLKRAGVSPEYGNNYRVKDILFGQHPERIQKEVKKELVKGLGFDPFDSQFKKRALTPEEERKYNEALDWFVGSFTTDPKVKTGNNNPRHWKPLSREGFGADDLNRRLKLKLKMIEADELADQRFSERYPKAWVSDQVSDEVLDLYNQYRGLARKEKIVEALEQGDILDWRGKQPVRFNQEEIREINRQLERLGETTPFLPKKLKTEGQALGEYISLNEQRGRAFTGERSFFINPNEEGKFYDYSAEGTPLNLDNPDSLSHPLESGLSNEISNVERELEGQLSLLSEDDVDIDPDVDPDLVELSYSEEPLSLIDKSELSSIDKENLFHELMQRDYDIEELAPLFDINNRGNLKYVNPVGDINLQYDDIAAGQPSRLRDVYVTHSIDEQKRQWAKELLYNIQAKSKFDLGKYGIDKSRGEIIELLNTIANSKDLEGQEIPLTAAPSSLLQSSVPRITNEELNKPKQDRLHNKRREETRNQSKQDVEYRGGITLLDPNDQLNIPPKKKEASGSLSKTEQSIQKALKYIETIEEIESIPELARTQEQITLLDTLRRKNPRGFIRKVNETREVPISLEPIKHKKKKQPTQTTTYVLGDNVGDYKIGTLSGIPEAELDHFFYGGDEGLSRLYLAKPHSDLDIIMDISGSDVQLTTPEDKERFFQYLDIVASDHEATEQLRPIKVLMDGEQFAYLAPQDRLAYRQASGLNPTEVQTYKPKYKKNKDKFIEAHLAKDKPLVESPETLSLTQNLDPFYEESEYYDSFSRADKTRQHFQLLSDNNTANAINEGLRIKFVDSTYEPLALDKDEVERLLTMSHLAGDDDILPDEVLALEEQLANPYIKIQGQYYPISNEDVDLTLIDQQRSALSQIKNDYLSGKIPRRALEEINSSFVNSYLELPENKERPVFNYSEVFGQGSLDSKLHEQFRELESRKTVQEKIDEFDSMIQNYQLDIDRKKSRVNELIKYAEGNVNNESVFLNAQDEILNINNEIDRLNKELDTLIPVIEEVKGTLRVYNALSTPPDDTVNIVRSPLRLAQGDDAVSLLSPEEVEQVDAKTRSEIARQNRIKQRAIKAEQEGNPLVIDVNVERLEKPILWKEFDVLDGLYNPDRPKVTYDPSLSKEEILQLLPKTKEETLEKTVQSPLNNGVPLDEVQLNSPIISFENQHTTYVQPETLTLDEVVDPTSYVIPVQEKTSVLPTPSSYFVLNKPDPKTLPYPYDKGSVPIELYRRESSTSKAERFRDQMLLQQLNDDLKQKKTATINTPEKESIILDTPEKETIILDTPEKETIILDTPEKKVVKEADDIISFLGKHKIPLALGGLGLGGLLLYNKGKKKKEEEIFRLDD